MKTRGPILDYSEQKQWREWLAAHYASEPEAWLLYAKKESGKARIAYSDAVEVALCFDWIDSINRSYDALHTMQRFTPRKNGAGDYTAKTVQYYSQANIERLRWLYKRNLIHASITEKVRQIIALEYQFPADIIAAIRCDEEAWRHYQQFPPGYRRIRIAYIDAARRRPEEFQKRLANFIAHTRQGKQIKGYGGVEKYY